MIEKAQKLLKQYFGYSSFRKGQDTIIQKLTTRQNTLGIMPTGGGKSICYQIPGLLMDGTALIISPLISLMKDQVDTLQSLGIPSTYINSSLSAQETNERINHALAGRYKFVYVAPERIESNSFLNMIHSMNISLIAFDEAHCISQWGHDFRPSYRSVIPAIKNIPNNPVIAALTATATPQVVQEICSLLNISTDNTIKTGFARDNLSFNVLKGVQKRDFVVDYLKKKKGESGIIYASTRKETDQLHSFLQKLGYSVSKYHAGLSEEERKHAQNEFIRDDIQIMVATNAFGMGIDKSNVRFVIHYHMPKNLEAYYQEAGRAGRDSEPSDCFLLFSGQDVQLQKFLIDQSESDETRKRQNYQLLQQMIHYCHTEQCLQSYILDYFQDDIQVDDCGKCSCCLDEREQIDITKEAQMIFSCVKRMGERFGVTLTAQVLKGSNNKRIKDFNFNTLTTYGLLSSYTEKDIVERINKLLAEGFLQITEEKYPIIKLAQRAVPVLKGEEKVYIKKLVVKESITNTDIDSELFTVLKNLRKRIADEENIPPYIVFSDATLKEMCLHYPENETAMLTIKGVGQAKLDQFGNRFIEVIKAYVNENGKIDRNSVKRMKKNTKKSHLETYDLYQEGLSIEDIAKNRGLSPLTIESHLFEAAKEGYDLDWDQIFNEETEALILKACEEVEEKKLKPLKEALPDEVNYFTIKAVLVKNGAM